MGFGRRTRQEMPETPKARTIDDLPDRNVLTIFVTKSVELRDILEHWIVNTPASHDPQWNTVEKRYFGEVQRCIDDASGTSRGSRLQFDAVADYVAEMVEARRRRTRES